MSEHNITVNGGSTVRLTTAGKYCDRDILVTALGSGIELPELTNPGTEEELFSGKELIGENGEKVVGTFTLDNEMSEQESLIAQIQTALVGKTASCGETNTVNNYAVIIKCGNSALQTLNLYVDGEIKQESVNNTTVVFYAQPEQIITVTSTNSAEVYNAKTFKGVEIPVNSTTTFPVNDLPITTYYHSFEMPHDHVYCCSGNISGVFFPDAN